MAFARCLIVCPAHKLAIMQSYFIEYPEQAMDLNMNATCVVPSPVTAGKVLYILQGSPLGHGGAKGRDYFRPCPYDGFN